MYHYNDKEFYENKKVVEEGFLDVMKGLNTKTDFVTKNPILGTKAIKMLGGFIKQVKPLMQKSSAEKSYEEIKKMANGMAGAGLTPAGFGALIFGAGGAALVQTNEFLTIAKAYSPDEKSKDVRTMNLLSWMWNTSIYGPKPGKAAYKALNGKFQGGDWHDAILSTIVQSLKKESGDIGQNEDVSDEDIKKDVEEIEKKAEELDKANPGEEVTPEEITEVVEELGEEFKTAESAKKLIDSFKGSPHSKAITAAMETYFKKNGILK
jgi:hypothetical protein